MKLRPHQTEGAAFLATAPNGRGYLNWEPRVGKTATAIAAADRVEALDILVLCPAIAKSNWAAEFARWQKLNREITILYGLDPDIPKKGGKPRVIIANYDLLSRSDSRVARVLAKWGFDGVVLDEAHFLKGKNNRTDACFGKRWDGTNAIANASVPYVWALSGTPAPNNYSELYPVLKALSPDSLRLPDGRVMTKWEFVTEFCDVLVTKFGTTITGSKRSKAKVLFDRIAPFMHHRKLADVAPNLPKLQVDTFALSPDRLSKDLAREIETLTENMKTWFREGDDLMQQLKDAAVHMVTERRALGLAKADLVADLVNAELQGGLYKKVVVFGVFHTTLDRIAQGLVSLGVVRIDGRTSEPDRRRAMLRFQNDEGTQVILAQVTAAGTAIDLSAANDVIFAECSWVPAENRQAMSRIVNLNKAEPCFARFATIPRSVDERITKALAAKSEDIEALFAGA